MRFATYGEALAWLEDHVNYESVAPNRQDPPTLEPVRAFLGAIADPQRDYSVVHVTGTNGKGTTTTLVAGLLGAAGLRTGSYTSPDLHAVNERITVAGRAIADADLVGLLARLSDAEGATGIVLTRFELLTVGALLHFSDEGVDVAAVEVGVGGTWDSTNVVDGAVTVLTNVDLDHVGIIGTTIAEIAKDKVGIFRPGATALVGTTDAVVVDIATRRAREIGSELWRLGEEFDVERNDLAVGGRLLTLRTPFARYEEVSLSLHGTHQGRNAAVAVTAAEALLGRALGEDAVRETLGSARMPGRLEVIAHAPTIVVDGAHNPAGARALAATLEEAFEVTGRRRCVLGMLTGREVDDMVEPLVAAGFDEFHCCAPASPRAQSAEVVASAVRRHGGVAVVHPSARAALAHARERSGEDDLIVAAGSLYLVAEVRAEVLQVPNRHLP